MLIHGKPLSEIKEDDLCALTDDQVPEGKSIEYKVSLPGNSDKDKKEFLADISSFSNSAGGHIFFGISESNGLPQELVGLEGIDPDGQILRLLNLLRDSIAPRIPGVNIRAIPIENKGPIIAIKVPRSCISPHMVTFAGISKFYSRNSAGKYQLDVFELRTAFNATHIEGERLRNFRADRISKVIANETPVPLDEGAKAILHVIPVNVFEAGIQYDLREFQLSRKEEDLAGIDASDGRNFRFNFDGVLTFDRFYPPEPANTYLQLFRNGIIESVCTSLFEPSYTPPLIPSINFEKEIVGALGRFFKILNSLEIEPPFFIVLTLLNVFGYNLSTRSRVNMGRHVNLIDRNDLLVPEILVEDNTLSPETILKPVFDAVWNSAGQPQSPFYDPDGNWNPQ